MNNALRKIAFFVGLGVLVVSMFWSQDGFNFDVAGDSGYKSLALFIGWFLAVAVTTMQFVFSSNFRELNPSLILFGALAYAYSMYTNYQGISHFQGSDSNMIAAISLAVIMDAAAEPLIAWSLGVSREGDFIGNIIKAIVSAPDKLHSDNSSSRGGNTSKSGHSNVYGQKKGSSGDFRFPSGKKSPRFNLHSVNDGMITKELSDDDTKPLFRD